MTPTIFVSTVGYRSDSLASCCMIHPCDRQTGGRAMAYSRYSMLSRVKTVIYRCFFQSVANSCGRFKILSLDCELRSHSPHTSLLKDCVAYVRCRGSVSKLANYVAGIKSPLNLRVADHRLQSVPIQRTPIQYYVRTYFAVYNEIDWVGHFNMDGWI